MDNKIIDENERLKVLAKERKVIIQEIFKIRDKVFEECDRVLTYDKKNNNDEKTY